MKRTAFLACALMAACAFAHAAPPAASAGPDVNVLPQFSMPALDVAVIAPQLIDATVFVADIMSSAYPLPTIVDSASHFSTSSSVHAAANDPRAGFDVNALYSPALYESAPPWMKAIGKSSRHARQIDRWRT